MLQTLLEETPNVVHDPIVAEDLLELQAFLLQAQAADYQQEPPAQQQQRQEPSAQQQQRQERQPESEPANSEPYVPTRVQDPPYGINRGGAGSPRPRRRENDDLARGSSSR